MKKLLSLLLAVVMLVSVLPFAGATFTDEAFINEYYLAAVNEMVEKGVLGGFENGSFGPRKTLTRAQAAKILCVMLEGAEKAEALTKTETGFADVPATHWAAKYVAYCVDKGIVSGVGDGKFDPDGKLISAAFAKMLLVAYGADSASFTGADWKKTVQAAAQKTLLLNQLGSGQMSGVMERQKAAQMAWNAMFEAEMKADKAKGNPRTMPIEVPETIKLFVIGNSYGVDSTFGGLWDMFKEIGVKNVTIGTLYYGGCRYEQHVDFALNDKPVYRYYKNTDGEFVTTSKTTFDKSINDEDWTHIMMLHGTAGNEVDFTPWQDMLITYVHRTHPNAYLGYDMTWAFRATGKRAPSMQADLDKYYGGDRMKMWESMIATTKEYVEGDGRFQFVVPAGTTAMNAQTSFIGDGIYRDTSSHLNMGVGRYAAAMTICCRLTGVSPDQIKYLPEDLVKNEKSYAIDGLDMTKPGLIDVLGKVAKESVKNALAKPYEITQSKFTTAP